MSTTPTTATTYVNDVDEITTVMQVYIDGARSGKGAAMKPAFHDDATICGYVGPDLFAGPIQELYDWNDGNGPATDVECRFARIDVVGTAASVRVDIDNWTGHRFTLPLAPPTERAVGERQRPAHNCLKHPRFDAVSVISQTGRIPVRRVRYGRSPVDGHLSARAMFDVPD